MAWKDDVLLAIDLLREKINNSETAIDALSAFQSFREEDADSIEESLETAASEESGTEEEEEDTE